MKQPNNISKLDWELLKEKYNNNLEFVIDKINNNYPVQYLIGNVDFYGYKIKVNPNVLIPRFETETLVEKTINLIKKKNLFNASVLDIGTGSGCISIALKKMINSLEVTAIDNSRKALFTAKKNAKLNKVSINFIYKDVFKYNLINHYDVIISNPPYIPFGDKVDPKTDYEPKSAIYVEGNSLKYYEKILEIATKYLNKNGIIAFEIDEDAGTRLKKLAKKYFPNAKIKIEKDLANKNRYMFVLND